MKRKLSLLMAFMMAATLVPAMPSTVHAASDNGVIAVKSSTSDGEVDVTLKVLGSETKEGLQLGGTFYINTGDDSDVISIGGNSTPNSSKGSGYPELIYMKKYGANQGDSFDRYNPKDDCGVVYDNADVQLALTKVLNRMLSAGMSSSDVVTAGTISVKPLASVSQPITIEKTAKNKLTVSTVDLNKIIKDAINTEFEKITITSSKINNASSGLVLSSVTELENKDGKKVSKADVLNALANELANTKKCAFGFNVDLGIKFDGANGAQKITIDNAESSVSSGDFTYATIGSDEKVLSVDKKEKISRSGDNEVSFTLKESVPTAFKKNDDIELRLPVNYSWKKPANTKNMEFSYGKDGDKEDRRILKITLVGNFDDNTTERLNFSAEVTPDRDAKVGEDVDVTVDGTDVSPSSLVIAEYVGYDVTVKADKVLSVIAGKDLPGKYVAKLTIEEPTQGGFVQGRYMEFKFVDEKGNDVDASLQDQETLKIKEDTGEVKPLIDSSSIETTGSKSTGLVKEYDVVLSDAANEPKPKKASEWDVKIEKRENNSKSAKFKLEIPFVVKSSYEGKLFLKVKGAGAEEQTVQIADVKAPVTFEVKGNLPQVKIGLQKQKGADIAVKETEAGALQDYLPSGVNGLGTKNEVEYKLVPDENFNITFKDANVKVTDGDLSIKEKADDDAYKAGYLFATVDRRSTKPSTLTFTNIEMTLDRTVPYGKVQLKGNFGAVGRRHDLGNKVKSIDYINTVTPIKDDKRVYTIFKIGDTTYYEKAGGVKDVEKQTMDVAPFIQENRTMLPARYVANALGASVTWDADTYTATFNRNSVNVRITTTDKNKLMYVNGTPIPLSTGATVKDGRIFLPLVNIAQAFGLQKGTSLIWNDADKSVVLLPQDASAAEIEAAQNGDILNFSGETAKKEEVKEEAKEEKKDDKKAEETKADEKKADDTKKAEETK